MMKKETLIFLKRLKRNNNKEWFDLNRSVYQEAKLDFEKEVATLIDAISIFDKAIANLEPKKCIFRINRDIRFSKDKTPYKTNFGASISPGGRKSDSPGYYFHLEPGNSFLAGGTYMPIPENLAAIRQEIDYNLNEFQEILGAKEFKKFFGTLHEVEKLKTVPKGYERDNPALNYLQHKSFLVVHELKDDQLLKPGFTLYCQKVFRALYPFNVFLRRATD